MNNPTNNIYDEITFAGKNNFDYIDLTIEPPQAQIENINSKNTLSLLEKYDLEVVGHTNFYMPWASPIKKLKDAAISEFSEQFELFRKLGAKKVSLHAHWYQPNSSKDEIIERIISSLTILLDLAQQNNITLMLEHQPTGFLNTPERLQPIFDVIKNLFFHLDVGHAQVVGGERNLTNEFLRKFGDKLAHVHFSDNKGKFDDHLPLGAGIINWQDIIRELKKIKYNDTITLEVWSKDRNYLLYSKSQLEKFWHADNSFF